MPTRLAVGAAEVDDLQVTFFPFVFGEGLFQVLLRFFYGTSVAESPALRQSVDVCVYRECGDFENVAHDDACGLVAYAGEFFQFLEGVRDFAVVLFYECFGEVVDSGTLGVEKSAGLDDFGDTFLPELDHRGRGVRLREENLRHLVDADVCTLGAQHHGDKHRVGIGMVERNGRIREQFVQLLGDELDFLLGVHTSKTSLFGQLYEGVLDAEHFDELLVVHVGKPGFARAYGHFGDGLLCFQQRVDLFFEGSLGDEPVDLNVARLPDTERAVGGLRLDGRVPPQVVMDDLRCRGEVEPGTARLERKDEHLAIGVFLEIADHFGALRLCAAAVVKMRAEGELLFDGRFQEFAHFGKLREDERLFALFLNGGEQVQQHLEFAGTHGGCDRVFGFV